MQGIFMTKAIPRLTGAALILCVTAALAAAQTAPAVDPNKAQEPPPVADKGTTVQLKCIGEEGQTLGHDGHLFRRIGLTNKCEQRLRCQAYAAAFGAQGVQRGQAVLILAAKSTGAAATGSYRFRIKEGGGMLTSMRHCRVF